jgi:hypothetical protein
VLSLDVASRKLLSLKVALPFDLWIQLRRRRSKLCGYFLCGHRNCLRWVGRVHLSRSDDVAADNALDPPQIARLGLCGVRRSDFSRPPSARERGQERGEIRFRWPWRTELAAVGEHDEMTLHRAYFLEQLQRKRCVRDVVYVDGSACKADRSGAAAKCCFHRLGVSSATLLAG